jgi:hypothetical protein
MSDFGRETCVTGRKDYSCEYCGETIPKGARQLYYSGRWENQFFAGRMHPECADAWRDLDGEPFDVKGMKRGSTEPRDF